MPTEASTATDQNLQTSPRTSAEDPREITNLFNLLTLISSQSSPQKTLRLKNLAVQWTNQYERSLSH